MRVAPDLGPAFPLPEKSPVPGHEIRYLALIPQLRKLVLPVERAKAFAEVPYADGVRSTGEYPGWDDPLAAKAWRLCAEAARDRNGYHEAWEAWSKHTDAVDVRVSDFMTEHMTMLLAIGWQAVWRTC